MKRAYDYLYTFAAACIIAIGSGFLALTPTFMEYEREAYELKYQYEAATGNRIERNSECVGEAEIKRGCLLAQHMLSTNSTLLDALKMLAYILLGLGGGAAAIGFGIHAGAARTERLERSKAAESDKGKR